MPDAMNFAEFSELDVELLPARTLLSLLHADGPGAGGDPGTPGSNGQSMSKFNFLGWIGWGGSNSGYTYSPGIGDAGSTTKSS